MTSDSDLTATCFKNYELQRWSDCRLKRVDHHNITLKSTAVFEWLIIFECRRGGCSVNAKERKRLRTYFTNNRKTMFDEMTSIPFVSRKFLLTAMKRVMMWEQSLLVKDIVSLSSNGTHNDVSSSFIQLLSDAETRILMMQVIRVNPDEVKIQVSLDLRFCRRVSRDFFNKTLVYLGWCLCWCEKKGQRNQRQDSVVTSLLSSSRSRLFQRRNFKRGKKKQVQQCVIKVRVKPSSWRRLFSSWFSSSSSYSGLSPQTTGCL